MFSSTSFVPAPHRRDEPFLYEAYMRHLQNVLARRQSFVEEQRRKLPSDAWRKEYFSPSCILNNIVDRDIKPRLLLEANSTPSYSHVHHQRGGAPVTTYSPFASAAAAPNVSRRAGVLLGSSSSGAPAAVAPPPPPPPPPAPSHVSPLLMHLVNRMEEPSIIAGRPLGEGLDVSSLVHQDDQNDTLMSAMDATRSFLTGPSGLLSQGSRNGADSLNHMLIMLMQGQGHSQGHPLSSSTSQQIHEIMRRSFAEEGSGRQDPLSTEELERLARTETSFASLPEAVRAEQSACLISQDTFESRSRVIRLSSCGHVFGASSILRWMGERRTCPLCRRDAMANTASESDAEAPSTPSNQAGGGGGGPSSDEA